MSIVPNSPRINPRPPPPLGGRSPCLPKVSGCGFCPWELGPPWLIVVDPAPGQHAEKQVSRNYESHTLPLKFRLTLRHERLFLLRDLYCSSIDSSLFMKYIICICNLLFRCICMYVIICNLQIVIIKCSQAKAWWDLRHLQISFKPEYNRYWLASFHVFFSCLLYLTIFNINICILQTSPE